MSARLTIRMAAPAILISLLLLSLGSFGGWYLLRVQKNTSSLVALDVLSIRAVEELVFNLYELRSDLLHERAQPQTILDRCAETEGWLAEAESLMDDPDEVALAGRVRQGYDQFAKYYRESAAAESQGNLRQERTRAEELLRGTLHPAKDLLVLEEALLMRSEKHNDDMAGLVAKVLLLLGVCGSAAGLVAGFGIARSVSRSLVELYVPIRAASGKLEEVIGPIDLVPSAGIKNLDTILHKMARQVETVVDRLQASQLQVLRSEQLAALGQLSAGMAHELRNPLTAIKILVESASARGPSANLSDRDLLVMQKEIARLERSVQTFLEFARPPKLERRLDDIRLAIDATLDLVRARADRQHVAVRREVPGEPIMIPADHEQLRQVFLNLLFNALDAMPNGGHICLQASAAPGSPGGGGERPARPWGEDGGSCVTITVTDDGPGLPKDLADKIFDPYVSTKDTGLGLGLAICRRIVEAHGGRIAAQNAPAGGAVFVVELPCPGANSPQGL